MCGADAVWHGLSRRGHADLVMALGAQARLVRRYAPGAGPRIARLQLFDLLVLLRGRVHAEARDYAFHALRGCHCAVPVPECADADRCLRAAAGALAEVRLRTGSAAGFSRPYIAVICRRAAR